MSRRRRIVEIKWRDSERDRDGWVPLDKKSYKRPGIVRTIGYLLANKKTHLVVAQSIGGGDGCNCFTIPAGCVESIRRIN